MRRNLTGKGILQFEKFTIVDGDGWEKLSAAEVYTDPYIQIEQAVYHSPSRPGEEVQWTIAHRKGAVAVAAKDATGRWIMVHQERFPVQQPLWEFPAGQIDDHERRLETAVILDTVHQELQEEVGCRLAEGAELIPLGYFFSSQGFTTEHVYLFVATRVEATPQGRVEVGNERIPDVCSFTSEELTAMVAKGEIRDALSLALFARMSARGFLGGAA
jgi:ADP-ribose pyrophosphatase